MKKLLKNLSFGVDFELQVPLLMYKIKAHNISGVRRIVMNNEYMNVCK